MKEAILVAVLSGAIGTGGTYTMMQYHQPDIRSAIQQARTEQDAEKAEWSRNVKQLQAQVAESIQLQKAMVEYVQGRTDAELALVARLDAHVVEVACLIKGCKPQAMR